MATTLVFVSCANSEKSVAPQTVTISSNASLPLVVLPFPKVSVLNEPLYFIETTNGILISNFTKGQLRLYKTNLFEQEVSTHEILFSADLDSLNLDFCAFLTEQEGIAFNDFSSFFYHFKRGENNISFKKVALPKSYDFALQDSIQLTIDRSVVDRPFLIGNEIIFHVYQIHTRQPNSMRNAFEAIYRAPLFLSYSLKKEDIEIIDLNLNKLGYVYDSIHMDDFVRLETRIGLSFEDNDHFFASSEKGEDIWYCSKKGSIEKTYSYSFAWDEPDFKLTTKETGKGPQYISLSAFYNHQWYTDAGKYLIRLLKRGASDENLGQKDTPWQILILKIEGSGTKLVTLLNFEAEHFDYADIHLLAERYLIVSNNGTKNKVYDPNNHSYSIIDLADYFN
jgi:hypothetical protein